MAFCRHAIQNLAMLDEDGWAIITEDSGGYPSRSLVFPFLPLLFLMACLLSRLEWA